MSKQFWYSMCSESSGGVGVTVDLVLCISVWNVIPKLVLPLEIQQSLNWSSFDKFLYFILESAYTKGEEMKQHPSG